MDRDLHTEFKQYWKKHRPALLEGKLCEVSEDASQRSGGILREFMYRLRAITSMSNNFVQSLLLRSVK